MSFMKGLNKGDKLTSNLKKKLDNIAKSKTKSLSKKDEESLELHLGSSFFSDKKSETTKKSEIPKKSKKSKKPKKSEIPKKSEKPEKPEKSKKPKSKRKVQPLEIISEKDEKSKSKAKPILKPKDISTDPNKPNKVIRPVLFYKPSSKDLSTEKDKKGPPKIPHKMEKLLARIATVKNRTADEQKMLDWAVETDHSKQRKAIEMFKKWEEMAKADTSSAIHKASELKKLSTMKNLKHITPKEYNDQIKLLNELGIREYKKQGKDIITVKHQQIMQKKSKKPKKKKGQSKSDSSLRRALGSDAYAKLKQYKSKKK